MDPPYFSALHVMRINPKVRFGVSNFFWQPTCGATAVSAAMSLAKQDEIPCQLDEISCQLDEIPCQLDEIPCQLPSR